MQTLYGNSFDSLAGQQQNYDRFNNDINQSNRADAERADREAAAYAFQRRQLENADEQTAAQYYSGFSRDMAQMQQAKVNRAEDTATNNYRFGVGQANQDRNFKLTEGQIDYQKERDKLMLGRSDNRGNAFASALSDMAGEREAAQAEYDRAQTLAGSVLTIATNKGAFDPVTKKWKGDLAGSYANAYRDRQLELKNATEMLKARNTEYARTAQSAVHNGFTVRDDGIVQNDTGTFTPFPARQGGAVAQAVGAAAGQPSPVQSATSTPPARPAPKINDIIKSGRGFLRVRSFDENGKPVASPLTPFEFQTFNDQMEKKAQPPATEYDFGAPSM